MGDYLQKIGKRGVNTAAQNVQSIAWTMGRALLHQMAPDNFEYYNCSLELFDGSLNSVGYMEFVVMPNNIVETKTNMLQITKTTSAVVTTFNSTFNPVDISIQGSFGRKLRILMGMREPDKIENTLKRITNGNFGINFMGGEVMVKTGYGLVRMLDKIVRQNMMLDSNNKPHFLVFRNYALNSAYVVEVLQHSYSQSLENNMIWNYNIEMRGVAPADELISPPTTAEFLKRVAAGAIANSVNDIMVDMSRAALQI